jgi:membrane protease YdiL (CAAX protease family)
LSSPDGPPGDALAGSQGVRLEGQWENRGRNPVVAAFIVLVLCGGLYFTLGSVVLSLIIGIDIALGGGTWRSARDLASFLEAYFSRYQAPILVVTMAGQYALFLWLPLRLIRRWHTPDAGAYVRLSAPSVRGLILTLVGVLASLPVVELLSRWTYVFFPVFRELSRLGVSLFAMRSVSQALLVVFAIAVTPGICEELLFRGYFQTTLSRRLSPLLTVTTSGMLFSLFHQSVFTMFGLLVVGLFLGYAFLRTGSLLATMAAHFLYNLTVLFITNIEFPAGIVTSSGEFTSGAIVVGLVVLLLCVWALSNPTTEMKSESTT